MAASGDIEDLRQRLQHIADELADLALDRLRSAVDADDPALAGDERRLSRARRAVEKAVAVLSEPEGA